MMIRLIYFVTYTWNPHSLNYVYSFILSHDSYFALHGRAKLRAGTDRETKTPFVMNCRVFFSKRRNNRKEPGHIHFCSFMMYQLSEIIFTKPMLSHLLIGEILAKSSNWNFYKFKFNIRPCTACCSVVFSSLTQAVFVLSQASLLGYFSSCKFRYTTTECCALPTSALLGTASSDPLNAVVNAGFRLQQKELKLPGKTGLLGAQVCSAWLLHIFNTVLNGSAHKISKGLCTWIYLSGSCIAVIHCRCILLQWCNK